MKSWKVLLGVGGACAACCMVPVGAVTALLAAATGGTALYSRGIVPVVTVAVAITVLAAGLWWRRRQAAKARSCDCASSCQVTQCG
jgi:hypothetical protein